MKPYTTNKEEWPAGEKGLFLQTAPIDEMKIEAGNASEEIHYFKYIGITGLIILLIAATVFFSNRHSCSLPVRENVTANMQVFTVVKQVNHAY